MAQVLLDRLELGATPPEAITRPRASQRNRAATEVEPASLQTREAAALIGFGHSFEEAAAGDIGAVTGLELGRRGGGSAAVVTRRP